MDTLKFTLIAALLCLSGCANREELYDEYVACLSSNQIVRTNEDGAVSMDANGNPLTDGDQSACVEQNEKWNRAEATYEMRKAIRQRQADRRCTRGVLVCESRGLGCYDSMGRQRSTCRCECVSRSAIFRY